jgi:hypothetical protein
VDAVFRNRRRKDGTAATAEDKPSGAKKLSQEFFHTRVFRWKGTS